ncbi:helix-turn-helix domain-containing protein [Streptomyces sp. NPDC059850]|uniref:helix-turn-helix domain-containing protein n=1 Tax=Streptomyces sp. NPDC059850 TaxID=3346970 RepID=UPI00365C7C62
MRSPRSRAQFAARRAANEACAKLKERYEGGASVRELAEEAGMSESNMRRLLVEAGAKMRRSGPVLGSKRRSRNVNDSNGS